MRAPLKLPLILQTDHLLKIGACPHLLPQTIHLYKDYVSVAWRLHDCFQWDILIATPSLTTSLPEGIKSFQLFV